MICQILFSRENKKNITNLSSAELAQRMVKVNKPLFFRYLTGSCMIKAQVNQG